MIRLKLIASASALALLLSGCQLIPVEETLPAVPVVQEKETVIYDQIRVSRGDLVLKKSVPCEYSTAQSQELSFSVGGEKIAAVYVREGDTVSKGELLAELEHESISQQIASQTYRLDVLELELTHLRQTRELELARQDAALAEAAKKMAVLEEQQAALTAWNVLWQSYEEALALWEAEPTPEEALKPQPPEPCTVTASPEELQAQYDALQRTQRDLQSARSSTENSYAQQIQSKEDSIYIQQLRIAELNETLKERQIYAGMDGMVRYLQAKSVQNTNADGSISYSTQTSGQVSVKDVTFIILVDTASLTFTVTGEDATYFPIGTETVITLDDQEIRAVSVEGKDSGIAYLQPTEPNPLLTTGDRGNIELILDQRENVLLLPADAIHTTGQEDFVYVLDDEGLRVMQTVTTGLRSDGYVEIVSGLAEGDNVVIA